MLVKCPLQVRHDAGLVPGVEPPPKVGVVLAPLVNVQDGLKVCMVNPRNHHRVLLGRVPLHVAVKLVLGRVQEHNVETQVLGHHFDRVFLRPLGRRAPRLFHRLEAAVHVLREVLLELLPLAPRHVVLEPAPELLPDALPILLRRREVPLVVQRRTHRVVEARPVTVHPHADNVLLGHAWKQVAVHLVGERPRDSNAQRLHSL